MAQLTVVFADITGSTGVFEALGNASATQAISKLTTWMSAVCASRGGYGIKCLGDGVMAMFQENRDALAAVTEMQQVHKVRTSSWPESLKMALQIGLARGEVVEQESEFYGDAVNVASRLSDLSGPEQIFAADTVMQQLPLSSLIRSRCLGALALRGRTEPCTVHRVEWQAEVQSEAFTMPASLLPHRAIKAAINASARPAIKLSWLDVQAVYEAQELPILLGRDKNANFVVQDRRVSRQHARIILRDTRLYLEDTSSYGTSVRFAGSNSVVALRRQECLLLQAGEIALGASFDDFTLTTIKFEFT